MKKSMQKLFALLLAVILSVPVGAFSTLAVSAETDDLTVPVQEQQYTEPTVSSPSVAYFSFAGNDSNNGLSATKMKKYLHTVWPLVEGGGTIVVPAKGWVDRDLTLEATSPVLITAKDTNGTLYYNPAAPAVNGDQKGMLMVAALKTLTFNSDVVFDDIVILQRDCVNASNVANIKVSNGATMVIGENVQFLYSTTVNTAKFNSRLTVDAGATLVVKAGGAHSYSGTGTIYLDTGLIGNGVELSQFSKFYGEIIPLGECGALGHAMGAQLVDGAYIEACTHCGYTENEPYAYTIPELTSDTVAFWGNDCSIFKKTVGAGITTVTGGAALSAVIPNGGTVYSVQKGFISDSYKFNLASTTKFTAVLPDNFAESVGYQGEAELNLDLREKDITGADNAQFGSIMTANAAVMMFESDVIFDKINFYCRDSVAPRFAICNGATAVLTDVMGVSTVSNRPILEVRAGATAILIGDNVGGFGHITGSGTVIVDPALFINGKLNAAVFSSFEGTVLTTEYKEACAVTGNHSYVGGVCEDCGWEDGSSLKFYVKHDGKGDGSSPTSPANSMRSAFTIDSDTPIEIILVDDLVIGGGIGCAGSKQDITITSMDVDGDGVYPRLIIQSFIVFENSGAGNTIRFENIEIMSDRSGSVPLFFCYNNLEIGEGVTCTLSGNYADADYPILYAGFLGNQATPVDTPAGRSNDYETNITVKSGTWVSLVGGNRKNQIEFSIGNNRAPMTINIEGGRFLGDASGIALTGCGFNFAWGDITLNVSGGDIEGDILGIGSNGQYGGTTPYDQYGYKCDVDINITGGTICGNIYAKYHNIRIPALVRGDVSVSIGAGATIVGTTMVDLRGTVPYSGESKVSTLTYDSALEGQITYKFADYVNGVETNAGEPVRIGFVGDSITQGHSSTNSELYSYPAQFAAMLDFDEYMVGNFGVSASGVLPSTKHYYNDTLQYHLLLEEFDPSIVSFTLGTNDALSAGGTYGVATDFRNRYYDMIESVCALDSVAHVYVATPLLRLDSPARQVRNVSIIEPAVRSIVSELCERGYDATVFELNANTYEQVLAGEVLSSDYLHPDNDGYAIMARAYYAAIFEDAADVPEGYYVDTFYVSTSGTLTGKGTADDPATHYEIGLARLNKNGGTLVILDNYKIDSDVVTPLDMAHITIRGNTPDAVLTWNGNTMKFGSDFVIDDVRLVTKSDGPAIIAWYNNATIGDGFTGIGEGRSDVVFVAGYLVYQDQSNAGAVETTTYDSYESASSDKDVSITIKNGTWGAVVLGNRRMNEKGPVGLYSGNMTACISGVTITGKCDYASAALAMMNLSGNINVTLDNVSFADGVMFYGASRTGALVGVVYDSSLNTGSVTISAPASVIEQHVAFSERSAGDAQYAYIDSFNVVCTTARGDMDEDGALTNADMALLVRVLSGWSDVTYANYSADLNTDAKINNRDAIELVRALAEA